MINNQLLSDLEPLSIILQQFNETKLALDVLKTFAKKATTYEQYDNVAKCFFKLKDYDNAITYSEIALLLADTAEKMYVSRYNLINVYNHANFPEKALRYIEYNELVIPYDVEIQLEKSYSYFLLNQKDQAEYILQSILKNDTNLTEEIITKIKFNLGNYLLLRDEFQQGMKLFLEEGAKMEIWKTETIFSRKNKINDARLKKWDGIIRPGSIIIIHSEAGIGDEIINFRFMKHLTKLGMIPYWYNSYSDRQDILNVFKRHGYNVIANLSSIKESNTIYYIQSMHLPIALNLTYNDLWYGPYLNADKNYVDKWSGIKDNSGKLKIALRWEGNTEYEQNLHRSIKLSELYENINNINAEFYSIQRDNGVEQLVEYEDIIDLSPYLKNWENTLGIIENMDCIITSCTSIAHASAAMGKRTFVFVPISSYYTWCHSTQHTPWYGKHVTILRQITPRSWKEPIEKLVRYLQNFK